MEDSLSSSSSSSFSSSFSSSNSLSSSSSTSTCCSVSGWIATGIYVCEDYNQNSWWCEIYGDSDVSEDGVSANEACCVCGGGSACYTSFPTSSTSFPSVTPSVPPSSRTASVTPSSGTPSYQDTSNCEDTPDWVDSWGDNCSDYASQNWCVKYGGLNAGTNNMTANEACCACKVTVPSASPSIHCEDAPDWVDGMEDNCTDYAINGWCEKYGDLYRGLYSMTANEACCACSGSMRNMLSMPSVQPSISPAPVEVCEDVPKWVDSWNDTCSAYADHSWCDKYGGYFAGLHNMTANEACCACGGSRSAMTGILAETSESSSSWSSKSLAKSYMNICFVVSMMFVHLL